MTPIKVYIAVPVEERLPDKRDCYYVATEDEFQGQKYFASGDMLMYDPEKKMFEEEEDYYAQPTHWLEEKECFCLTRDELVSFIIDSHRKMEGYFEDTLLTPEQAANSILNQTQQ